MALVLLCDGSQERARDLAARIEGIGHKVRVTATSIQARAILRSERVDLLIAASKLEDGAGADLLASAAQVIETDEGRRTPASRILIVDEGDEEAMRAGQLAGVDEFLSLPLGARELSARIRRVLGMHFLIDALASDDRAAIGVATGKVLVAEDEEDLRNLMKKLLERTGYDVLTACDGREALEIVAKERPDLVLMDLRMPEIDGIEACRIVKSDPQTRHIAFIMVTGVDTDQGSRGAYKAGADDYLVKPVKPSELLVRMKTLLRIQALRAAKMKKSATRAVDDTELEGHGDVLEEWFGWHEKMNGDPAFRDLRRRTGESVGKYLEGLHGYRPEIFRDPDADRDKVRRAYGEMRELIRKRIEQVLQDEPAAMRARMNARSRVLLIQDEVNDRFSFGPIQPLIDDPRITDILVNRWNEIHIELGGRLIRTPIVFEDEGHLRRIMTVVLRYAGKELNETRPYVESRLRDGSRVSATVPPLSIDGATLTIRKFVAKRLDLEDLLRAGTLSPEMASLMALMVRAGFNIIVSGATGAGKTTLLNLLGSCIPLRERIITVEDTAELRIRNSAIIPEMMGRREADREAPASNMERFEARASHIEGLQISIRDIIRLALRKRPDRIIVGEVRGAEALDMLNAMNTGHRGCLTTIHANNTADMMLRLENMVLEANSAMPLPGAQRIIVAALNMAIQVIKFADNTRRITEITEISAYDSDKGCIVLRPFFEFRPGRPDPFELVEAPSPRMRALIEEYLMKTGKYQPNWDRPLDPAKGRNVLKSLFRRHVSVHFEDHMMRGANAEAKIASRRELVEWIVSEVYDSGHVVAMKTSSGESMAVSYCDLVDNDFLLHLHAGARRRMAGRLALSDSDLELVVRDAVPDRSAWERIFPPESRPRPGTPAPHGTGEGLMVDDVRASFLSFVEVEAARLERDGIFTSLGSAALLPRLRRLESILPYLVIAEEE